MRYYDRTTLMRRGIVVEEPRLQCPECHCDTTVDENLHLPDCRFFPLDEEFSLSEDDAVVLRLAFRSGEYSGKNAI